MLSMLGRDGHAVLGCEGEPGSSESRRRSRARGPTLDPMNAPRATRADLAVAVVLTAFGVVSVLTTGPAPGNGVERDPDALAAGLAVLSTAPLVLRRAAPFAVLLVTSAALVTLSARGSALAASGLGPILAAASAAYLTDRRGAIASGAVLVAVLVLSTVLAVADDPGYLASLTAALVIGALATLVGDTFRTLHERNRELERLRSAEARAAVAQERVRIARDLHDIVGHALAGITLQARAGRRWVARDARRAETALGEIDELATRALQETREAIGHLGGDAAADPTPGLDDLPALVGRLQHDDLHVDLRAAGVDAAAVPPLVQASAYRIVQEALSNVIKHARPATAVVTVATSPTALRLDVHDDGRRRPSGDGRGHGLRGMRERAAQCGGTLEAGPDPAGGWRVAASLPIAGRPA